MDGNDEAKRRTELDRGARAHRIFDDELFKEAVGKIRDSYVKEFKDSPIHDTIPGRGEQMRLTARVKLSVLEDIVSKLHEYVETGKLAQVDLARAYDIQRPPHPSDSGYV